MTSRHATPIVLIAAMASMVACAPTISTSAHVDRTVDFSRYHTYDWGPADALPTGDPRLDQNPFFKDHVQGAVERRMAAKGLSLASAPNPDLLIHYHANVTRRFEVNRADHGSEYCERNNCASDVTSYEAGTLVLDVVDARTNVLLWRGWAQNRVEDMLRNDDQMARIIDRAVQQMLARFPREL